MANTIPTVPLTKDQIIGSFRRDLLYLRAQLTDLSRSIFYIQPKQVGGLYIPPNTPLVGVRLNQQSYKLLIAVNTFNVMYTRSVSPLMGNATPNDAKRFEQKFVSSDQWLTNFLQLNGEFPGKLDLLNAQLTGRNKKSAATLVAYANDFYNWYLYFVAPWYLNPLTTGPTSVNY